MVSRDHKVRHLWDLRWHEVKRAVAQGDAVFSSIAALSVGSDSARNRTSSVSDHIDLNGPWARKSYTCSTSTSPSRSGDTSGPDSGLTFEEHSFCGCIIPELLDTVINEPSMEWRR